jgi:chemotaxis protein CheX
MKAEYINPFVIASFSVLEMVLGEAPVRGPIAMQSAVFTSQQCNIICGVLGAVQGQVIYGMSLTTADRIASLMLGQPIESFDALAASALGELGNMISGNAMQHFSEAQLVCDITPPTIMRGTNVQFSTLTIPTLIIPMTMPQGEITITLSLQGSK